MTFHQLTNLLYPQSNEFARQWLHRDQNIRLGTDIKLPTNWRELTDLDLSAVIVQALPAYWFLKLPTWSSLLHAATFNYAPWLCLGDELKLSTTSGEERTLKLTAPVGGTYPHLFTAFEFFRQHELLWIQERAWTLAEHWSQTSEYLQPSFHKPSTGTAVVGVQLITAGSLRQDLEAKLLNPGWLNQHFKKLLQQKYTPQAVQFWSPILESMPDLLTAGLFLQALSTRPHEIEANRWWREHYPTFVRDVTVVWKHQLIPKPSTPDREKILRTLPWPVPNYWKD